METYVFTGKVYYGAGTTKVALTTTITIIAPSAKIARAIVLNYGLDGLKLQMKMKKAFPVHD